MASLSYQRSKAELGKRGYVAGKTEQPWNQFSKVRQDFCGFADIIAFHPDLNETLAIQACDDSGVHRHLTKLKENPKVFIWIGQPSRKLELWAWGKRGDRGKRKMWTLRSIGITKDILDCVDAKED